MQCCPCLVFEYSNIADCFIVINVPNSSEQLFQLVGDSFRITIL